MTISLRSFVPLLLAGALTVTTTAASGPSESDRASSGFPGAFVSAFPEFNRFHDPRYLQLLAGDGLHSADPQVIFQRLTDAAGRNDTYKALFFARVVVAVAPDASGDVVPMLDRLDRAVADLGVSHPRAAEVVQLKFIGDLTIEEIAEELGLSTATVKREWTFAKAWLAAAMESEDTP